MTNIGQDQVIAALRDRSTWSAAPAGVDVIETNAALVFQAGDEVLKIKRAVKLDYLDFTTLDARHRVCLRELEINQATAGDLYLDVVAIRQLPNGLIVIGGDAGEIVEWGVRMRRFAQEDLLSNMATRGEITPAIAIQLADRIAASHRVAVRSLDRADRVATLVRDITGRITRSLSARDQALAAEIAQRAADAVVGSAAVRAERADSGFVRRCHGDLHLANIVMWRGVPTLFDALEFDETLATVDTLYDLAFLLMDLDRKGAAPLANVVLNRYLWRTGDALDLAGLCAMPLYLGLRAAVRAIVALDRIARAGQAADVATIMSTLERADCYLKPPPARLIAIGGLSGTGKTTLAAGLAPEVGATPGALHLRTDLERKWLAGVDALDRLSESAYTDKVTRSTYDRVMQRAATTLSAGHAVIVDGVFSTQSERGAIEDIARRANVPFCGIWLEAAPQALRARVTSRRGDASDATVTVVERQLASPPRVPDWHHVDANGTTTDVIGRARRLIEAIAG